MNDLKERLEEHARWLEEAGESKVRAHVNPETCKQAAEDIREAAKALEPSGEQSTDEAGLPLRIYTREELTEILAPFGSGAQLWFVDAETPENAGKMERTTAVKGIEEQGVQPPPIRYEMAQHQGLNTNEMPELRRTIRNMAKPR